MIKVKSSFHRLYPHLVEEWHPDKNMELTPFDISVSSAKKIWWICRKGHEWQARVFTRTRNGSGCPYCAGRLASPENNLALRNPALAREWHPTKNGDLTPADVLPNSTTKRWWLCPEGHEWESTVGNRNSGSRCPYCSGKLATQDRNLAVLFPDVALEWHPTKNGSLKPEDLPPYSNKRVWWLCPNGHEWQVRAMFRTLKGATCPLCNKSKRACDDNITILLPSVARQWNWEKNQGETPEQVLPASVRTFWWKCEQGHEWREKVQERSIRPRCPECPPETTPSVIVSLAEMRPDLAMEWDGIGNGSLTPNDVEPGSGRTVRWKCRFGHEWSATVYSRYRGAGCPICNPGRRGGKIRESPNYKQLALEWHPTKNGGVILESLPPRDNRHKYWWRCAFGHEWEASTATRTSGSGCPDCAGTRANPGHNLALAYPHIAREWHAALNGELTPDQVSPTADVLVWWQCKKGHEWQSLVRTRVRAPNCPLCAGWVATPENNLEVANPKLAGQWHPILNGDLTPRDVTPNSGRKVWWQCGQGHQWQARVNTRSRGAGCKQCWLSESRGVHRESIARIQSFETRKAERLAGKEK